MSRDNNIKPAEIKNVYDRVAFATEATPLTISSSAYAVGDYLHTGVLALPVFPETVDSYIEIEKIIIREVLTSGTLAKSKLKFYFFTDNDMSITANGAFALTDGTNTTLADLEDIVSIATADWVEPFIANTINAIAVKVPTVPVLLKNLSTTRSIYLIILADEVKTYDASAKVYGEIYVRYH